MSAFIVCKSTIDGILTAFHAMRSPENRFAHTVARDAEMDGNGKKADETRAAFDATGELTAIGQMLVEENYRSVNFRYQEANVPEAYTFTALAIPNGTDGVIWARTHGLIRCLNYQSCETTDYEDSEACEWLMNFQQKIEAILVPEAVNVIEEERYTYISGRLPKTKASWEAHGPDVFMAESSE